VSGRPWEGFDPLAWRLVVGPRSCRFPVSQQKGRGATCLLHPNAQYSFRFPPEQLAALLIEETGK